MRKALQFAGTLAARAAVDHTCRASTSATFEKGASRLHHLFQQHPQATSGSGRGFASGPHTKKGRQSAAEMGMYGAAAAIGMVGVSYAMVPLYKMFCAATGYGGALAGAQSVEEKLKKRMANPNAAAELASAEREVTVWFNADVTQTMQAWKFKPTQEFVKVKPGQSTLVFFTAQNISDQPITGVSTYNVSPDRAAQYFNKIQCFCFEQQRLRPGELIDMPVFFYLDPEFSTDWSCRNVDDLTLSYMFHKVSDEDAEEWDDGDDTPAVARTHGTAPATAVAGAAAIPQPTPAALGTTATAAPPTRSAPPAPAAAVPSVPAAVPASGGAAVAAAASSTPAPLGAGRPSPQAAAAV